jgi:hypothetical protein
MKATNPKLAAHLEKLEKRYSLPKMPSGKVPKVATPTEKRAEDLKTSLMQRAPRRKKGETEKAYQRRLAIYHEGRDLAEWCRHAPDSPEAVARRALIISEMNKPKQTRKRKAT